MTAQEIKSHIYENELIETILEALGCHHIKKHGDYYTAANPDGNNNSAIVVYDSEVLTTINYTRQLTKTARQTDIFDLIVFYNGLTFPEALKWTCNALGLDYYSEHKDLPESLQILRMLTEMSSNSEEEDRTPLKPISEKILDYYIPYGNLMFVKDNIPIYIQEEFGIGYCPYSNYITIPIYDELSTLVGIKGRYLGEPDEYHTKYLYLEKVNKSRVLYGYAQNKDYIKGSSKLFIVESEKAVMQLAGLGYRNVVSTGGKTISKYQVEMIIRTGCSPIFAFDKDVTEEELTNIANMFLDGISVYSIIDKENILSEKESPSDDPDKWMKLVTNHIYQLK